MKNLFKKSIVLLTCLVLAFSAVFAVACQPADTEEKDEPTPTVPQITDRTDYDLASTVAAYPNKTVNDAVFGNADLLEGYMLGDAVNGFLSAANDDFNGSADTALDLTAYFGYDYYTDGKWYSRSEKKPVHAVLNVILSYKLDGSEPLDINDELLLAYENDALLTVVPTAAFFIQLDTSGTLAQVFSVKIGDITKLLSGDDAKVAEALRNVTGELTIKQVLSLFGYGVTENTSALEKKLGELKLSYIASLSMMTERAFLNEMRTLFNGYTAGDLAALFGVYVAEDFADILITDLIGDYAALNYGKLDDLADLVEKYVGTTITLGDLFDGTGIPVKEAAAQTTFGELSFSARTAAENYVSAAMSDGLADEETIIALGRAVYTETLITSLLNSVETKDFVGTTKLTSALLTELDALLQQFARDSELFGKGLTEDEFLAAYNEKLQPVFKKVETFVTETKLFGEYTIAQIIDGLVKEDERETTLAALDTIMSDENALLDLETKLTAFLGEVAEFLQTKTFTITFTIGNKSFTLGDALEYIAAAIEGVEPTDNALYEIFDEMTVSELVEFIGSIEFPTPSDPVLPDGGNEDGNGNEGDNADGIKPSNGVELPVVPFS